jgi:hypothetical protein
MRWTIDRIATLAKTKGGSWYGVLEKDVRTGSKIS